MKRSSCDHIIRSYQPLLTATTHDQVSIGSKMAIPKFSQDVILEVVNQATQIFKEQGPLLELQSPIMIIGDLHGNIRDLCRLVGSKYQDENSKFLFLGDFVDRGPCSLEVITLLYAFVSKFPHRFFLIRGNHEMYESSKACALEQDALMCYQSDAIADPIYKSFGWMPLACTINKAIFCVHGGLSPLLKSLDDIRNVKLPIYDWKNEMVADMLWSDPDPFFTFMESTRGKGKLFSDYSAKAFLENNKLCLLIRAHQVVEEGVDFFSPHIITVFSSSFNNSTTENKAGMLIIDADGKIETLTLKPYPDCKRKNYLFNECPNVLVSRFSSLSVLQYNKLVYPATVTCFTRSPILKKKRRNSAFPTFNTASAFIRDVSHPILPTLNSKSTTSITSK